MKLPLFVIVSFSALLIVAACMLHQRDNPTDPLGVGATNTTNSTTNTNASTNSTNALAGLPSGCIAAYHFENNLNDSTTNGYHLASVGATAVGFAAGTNGQAATFLASDDAASNGGFFSNYGGTGLTVCAWVKYSASGYGAIVCQKRGDAVSDAWVLYANSSYFWKFQVHTTFEASTASANGAGTWHHAAGVWDGSSIKLYFNGALVSNLGGVTTLTAGGPFQLGRTSDGTPAEGDFSIDELYLFNRVLTATEITNVRDRVTNQ